METEAVNSPLWAIKGDSRCFSWKTSTTTDLFLFFAVDVNTHDFIKRLISALGFIFLKWNGKARSDHFTCLKASVVHLKKNHCILKLERFRLKYHEFARQDGDSSRDLHEELGLLLGINKRMCFHLVVVKFNAMCELSWRNKSLWGLHRRTDGADDLQRN